MALHNRILSLHQDPENLYYRATFPAAQPALPTPPASHAPSVAAGAEEDDTPASVYYTHL